MKKGVIQNDEYLVLALIEDREFAIPCTDEKDCNSKRVSLYNARRTMSPDDQRKIKIQKTSIDGKFFVLISKAKNEVMEVINGRMLPIEDKRELREGSISLIKDMFDEGIPDELILESLLGRDESAFSTKQEIERLRLERTSGEENG